MRTHLLLLVLASLLLACGPSAVAGVPVPDDGGGGAGGGGVGDDGGQFDSGTNDAGTDDSGTTDAGTPDAGSVVWQSDGGWPWPGFSAAPCEPEPPRVMPALAMPVPSNTVTVTAGQNLQTIFDAAQPGDEIVLPAGTTFTGNFQLKPKVGTGWITVRTSDLSSLPPSGTRLNPATDAPHLSTLQTATNGLGVIDAKSGAAHWRFVGIEFSIAPSVNTVYSLVMLGDGSQTSLAQQPHDLIIDRSWVHGNDVGAFRRGVYLNGGASAVLDSVVENFHEVGSDSQAVSGYAGAGPYALINNYLEGAGETVMFGGADPIIANVVPSDIAILHNHITKRLTWKQNDPSYAGQAYQVKNLLELKDAHRVWIEGNLIERSWPMAQSGFAMLLTPRNQQNTAPWSGVQDVTIQKNIIRSAVGGATLASADDLHSSQTTQRVRFWNNLLTDIGTAQWGSDSSVRGFNFGHGGGTADCIDYQHNTLDQAASFAVAGDSPVVSDHFTLSNNIAACGNYGFGGSNVGDGSAALNYYFTNWAMTKNVIFGTNCPASHYPTGNSFPTAKPGVGFVDAANGDYHLSASSPFKGTATDGKDPGADIDAVNAAVN